MSCTIFMKVSISTFVPCCKNQISIPYNSCCCDAVMDLTEFRTLFFVIFVEPVFCVLSSSFPVCDESVTVISGASLVQLSHFSIIPHARISPLSSEVQRLQFHDFILFPEGSVK